MATKQKVEPDWYAIGHKEGTRHGLTMGLTIGAAAVLFIYLLTIII